MPKCKKCDKPMGIIKMDIDDTCYPKKVQYFDQCKNPFCEEGMFREEIVDDKDYWEARLPYED